MQPAAVSKVAITVMALREQCMHYFKGHVTGNVARNKDIKTIALQSVLPEGRYQYERYDNRSRNVQLVFLKDVPLFRVQHDPNSITFYLKTLRRSPQLREVHAELVAFVRQYLPGVRIIESEEVPRYA